MEEGGGGNEIDKGERGERSPIGKLTQIKLQLCNRKNVESELLTIVE